MYSPLCSSGRSWELGVLSQLFGIVLGVEFIVRVSQHFLPVCVGVIQLLSGFHLEGIALCVASGTFSVTMGGGEFRRLLLYVASCSSSVCSFLFLYNIPLHHTLKYILSPVVIWVVSNLGLLWIMLL